MFFKMDIHYKHKLVNKGTIWYVCRAIRTTNIPNMVGVIVNKISFSVSMPNLNSITTHMYGNNVA